MALARVLDVAHQMLDSDLLFDGGLDARGHVDELAVHVAVRVDLLLREVSFGRQVDLVFLANANNDECRL